jgi:hypothetical protein
MTTTTLTLRRIFNRDPWVQRSIGRAVAFRTAARWSIPDSVHPYTRESFRAMMRSAAQDAISEAKRIALKGGAL